MTEQERSTVTTLLEVSAASVRASAANLSELQANFRPTEGAWSTLEVLEHLVLIEHGIFRGVGQMLATPAQPELKAEVAGKDETLINLVPLRRRRAPSPEMFLPPGVCRPLPEALAAFDQARAITLDFARTTQADLRSHFSEHPRRNRRHQGTLCVEADGWLPVAVAIGFARATPCGADQRSARAPALPCARHKQRFTVDLMECFRGALGGPQLQSHVFLGDQL